MCLQLWDMRRILLWRSMTLLLYPCSRTCGAGGEIHGYSNAPIFCKWLIGTGEEMRIKKFTLNLLAPTYLYFLALLRTSFSMCKGSSSDSKRQKKTNKEWLPTPKGSPEVSCISMAVCQSTNPSAKAGRVENTTTRGLSSRQGRLCVSRVPEGEDRRMQQPRSCP